MAMDYTQKLFISSLMFFVLATAAPSPSMFGNTSAGKNVFKTRPLTNGDFMKWQDLFSTFNKRLWSPGQKMFQPDPSRFMNWDDMFKKRFKGANSFDGFKPYSPTVNAYQNWRSKFELGKQ